MVACFHTSCHLYKGAAECNEEVGYNDGKSWRGGGDLVVRICFVCLSAGSGITLGFHGTIKDVRQHSFYDRFYRIG